jgi:arylsulfatase A-like enzyme
MSTTPARTPAWRTLVDSAKAALWAGILCGALFGLLDGIVAALVGSADLGFGALVGCLAAAMLQYGLVWCAALLVATIALFPMLARKADDERFVALMRIGLWLGIFLEIYWWTRTFVFYGRPAASPERLAATAAMLAISLASAWYLAKRALVLRGRAWILVPIVVAWIGGAIFLRNEGNALGDRGAKTARNADMPNVLLVVVDALRQDTLGCYGHPRVKSPNIDRLASEGVLFENAFTQAPFTTTSFGSLLTGKYPRRHGLVKMVPDARFPSNITLAYHLKTAPFAELSARRGEDLTANDYLCATFHTGAISTAGSRLLRGFDVYFEQMAGHGVVVADSPWSVFRSDLLLYVFKQKLAQRAGNDVTGVAKRWLAENAKRRFFAMVHLYSTHTPYDPAPEFKRMYADPAYTGPVKSFYFGDREAIESGRATPTPADVEAIRNLYYGGVSEADANIGVLLRELEAQGVLDDTLVIVTADHGESLGEQNLWEHNHMVQTNLRVPLVMRWPKKLPRGVRVNGIVDEIDVVPTVCSLLELESPKEPGDYGQIDGETLMPLLGGRSARVRRFSFAENPLYVSVQDARWKLVVPAEQLLSKQDRARNSDGAHDIVRLFDLQSDPREEHECKTEHPDEAKRLLDALTEWDRALPIRKSDEVLSARDVEQNQRLLEKLGYAGQGIGGTRKTSTNGTDKQ